MLHWKAYTGFALLVGLGLYFGLGGDFPASSGDCYKCYMRTFQGWVDDGYRYLVAAGLILAGVTNYLYYRFLH